MKEKAIEKIKKEMDKNIGNLYIQVIGDYLLKQIELNKEAMKKICSEKNSIGKSIKEIEKIARKGTANGNLEISENGLFKIIREYYKFEAVQERFLALEMDEILQELEEEESNKRVNVESETFNFNIDDYF